MALFYIKYFHTRFYKAEGKLTPEIYAVAEFMAAQLGDCSGDQEHIFMVLRVRSPSNKIANLTQGA